MIMMFLDNYLEPLILVRECEEPVQRSWFPHPPISPPNNLNPPTFSKFSSGLLRPPPIKKIQIYLKC